ncbi:hypothetical protein QSU92_07780 [Microbacterium sp. ET2]|uniref:hypothetical protein n=1 Tax=Microbacterium albipurpureum TaxID=3050384 RepID=UPI00259C9D2E|nr:hypothetical protein [Microbacterium sp. ET2 (Ac-2212)]WJL97053.1 hypothetical protein QSU92_07780 [Microbacterium sp. ET2 (Ac-2212)]
MRVQKSDIIGGLPASIARDVVRRYRLVERTAASAASYLEGLDIDAETAVQGLAAEGFLEPVASHNDNRMWWTTTLKGNALSMASFGKPIKRATAERLLSGVIERAKTYNADPQRIRFIERLRVFGSYLDPDVQELGDIDLEVVIGRRPGDVTESSLAYARASGRSFSTYLDRLTWADHELIQFLRNRSAAVNITQEDIDALTDLHGIVYSIGDDPGAIPAR